jgi:uncharacterized protein YdeI (YjbR/CyaY-like superfamily)
MKTQDSILQAFDAAMAENREAQARFQVLPPSHRKAYLDYIGDAKKGETRARRILKSIEMLADGKPYSK